MAIRAIGVCWTTTCMIRPTRSTICSHELAARCPNPLTLILERDGSYPPMDHLLKHLDLAREAMARGRVS